jgi:hypothetical protein
MPYPRLPAKVATSTSECFWPSCLWPAKPSDDDRPNSPDGSRFYIKGVAYQPQGMSVPDFCGVRLTIRSGIQARPLMIPTTPSLSPPPSLTPWPTATGCARDVPILQELGVNVIRVYSVDNTLNHDSCMSALDQAGIYTMYASFHHC